MLFSVFVVHEKMKMKKGRRVGDSYWKMEIESIRRGEDETWIIGKWLYEGRDLTEMEFR